MLKIVKKIMSTFTSMSTGPWLPMSLLNLSISFAEWFALKMTKLASKPHRLFGCFVVFCVDIRLLITKVCFRRSIDQSCVHVNIGMDFGQTCLEVCLPVLNEDRENSFESSEIQTTGALKFLSLRYAKRQNRYKMSKSTNAWTVARKYRAIRRAKAAIAQNV